MTESSPLTLSRALADGGACAGGGGSPMARQGSASCNGSGGAAEGAAVDPIAPSCIGARPFVASLAMSAFDVHVKTASKNTS